MFLQINKIIRNIPNMPINFTHLFTPKLKISNERNLKSLPLNRVRITRTLNTMFYQNKRISEQKYKPLQKQFGLFKKQFHLFKKQFHLLKKDGGLF